MKYKIVGTALALLLSVMALIPANCNASKYFTEIPIEHNGLGSFDFAEIFYVVEGTVKQKYPDANIASIIPTNWNTDTHYMEAKMSITQEGETEEYYFVMSKSDTYKIGIAFDNAPDTIEEARTFCKEEK